MASAKHIPYLDNSYRTYKYLLTGEPYTVEPFLGVKRLERYERWEQAETKLEKY
jgi:hypothetical protein